MPRGKKIKWNSDDVFCIPFHQGGGDANRHFIGQIVSHEPDALNSVICTLFSGIYVTGAQRAPLTLDMAISAPFITRDALDRGDWPIVGKQRSVHIDHMLNIGDIRAKNYVGIKIRSSEIIRDFMAAYHGILPWDLYPDKNYFDDLLLPWVRRPSTVFFRDNSA